MPYDLFLCVGEKSGDLHAEKILLTLQELAPDLTVAGIAGPRMRAAGIYSVLPMEEFQVMGFVDVFLALPHLIRQFYYVAQQILELKPSVVLFIDYPGFNLRMARYLNRRGFAGKLCHYISPSVWAWGKKRIPFMAEHLDLLLTIFPFEKRYFSSTDLPVAYVGNPLIQRIQEYAYLPHLFPQNKKILAIFPGSRKKELERNLPLQLRVCTQLQKNHSDLLFFLSLSDEKLRPLMEEILRKEGWENKLQIVPSEKTYELMQAAYAAIATSGTVTLELALHRVPTVVTYAISRLDLLIARDILRIRLPHYCLVNIILEREVFPELFGPYFTEENLHTKISSFITDTPEREHCQAECSLVKEQLSERNASVEAAHRILALLNAKSATPQIVSGDQ